MPDLEHSVVTIRSAVVTDVTVLCDIARTAKAGWPYPAEWLESWRDALTITEADLERWRVRVAETVELPGSGVVGFCAVSLGAPHWTVEHLWVSPSAERRGAGRALMADAIAAARAAGIAALELDADPHAEPFYLRLGGQRIASTPAPMPGAPERVLPRIRLET